MHHPDWSVGAAAVEQALSASAPPGWLDAAAARAAALVDRAPVEVLHAGSGWGALEDRRRQAEGEPPLSRPGAPFDAGSLGPEQEPWLDLLRTGTVDLDLSSPPPSYQVAAGWRRRLEQATGPAADLLAGVAAAYGGEGDAARSAWRRSLDGRPNAWAWRDLAVLASDVDAGLAAYREARALAPDLVPLVLEHLTLLLEAARPVEALAEVDRLPAGLRAQPRVRLLEARAAVASGEVARAGGLLEPGLVVPQLREGARLLEDLWYGYRALRLVDDGLAPAEAVTAARREPLPAVYDFSMTAPAT